MIDWVFGPVDAIAFMLAIDAALVVAAIGIEVGASREPAGRVWNKMIKIKFNKLINNDKFKDKTHVNSQRSCPFSTCPDPDRT